MASKIKVDQLETADGTGTIALQNQLSGLASASMPAGTVLQVLINEDGTALTTTSSSFQDSGLSLAITPSSTSSKIYALWTMQAHFSSSGDGFGTQLVRGSTNVWTSGTKYDVYTADAPNMSGHRMGYSYNYIDSPSTTSTITYKVQVAVHGGASTEFNDDGTKTQLVLMEIAG